MSSTKQSELSFFIKSIHKKLRQEAKILGTEKAWKNHCDDRENLDKYAAVMHQLADQWDKNSENDHRVTSRATWVYTASMDYFTNIRKHREKELHILKSCLKIESVPEDIPTMNSGEQTKYRLLDVGSCYNLFQQFDILEVLPIDIAPANKEVLNCDFLNVIIENATVIEGHSVKQLEGNSFDIVTFCLLLEYFPSPQQRLHCCLNAYKLLKAEGILVVITPDSNHVGSNAKIYKSWRYVLAKHGFIRIKYEKLPYIHCMVFRKALFKIVAKRWAEVHESEDLFEEIFIPQDFTASGLQQGEEFSISVKEKDDWNEDTFLTNISVT